MAHEPGADGSFEPVVESADCSSLCGGVVVWRESELEEVFVKF